MGQLIRSIDWSETAVGPVDRWPQSLRTVLSILLTSEHPIFLWWGPDLVQFYNDGYRPILGSTKHPAAMGQRGRECWSEIWEIIEPMIAKVFAGGSTYIHDGLLPLERHGFPEECYFDYAYSPVRDESGEVAGVFVACSETTGRVLSERRMTVLGALAGAAIVSRSEEVVCRATAEVLDQARADAPFVAIYLLDPREPRAVLPQGRRATELPPELPVDEHGAGWSAHLHRARHEDVEVDLRDEPWAVLEGGPWPEPTRRALLVPLRNPSDPERPFGFLLAGLSPRLVFDDHYRQFLRLAGGHIATGLANVRERAAERRRAETLAEVDRAKTAFFSNVSHEFRTPLTLMLAPIEDMRSAPVRDSDEHDRIELLHRNAQRLLKLVNTLLEFSRIEAGRVDALYEPVDLSTLSAEIASSFRAVIERAGLAYVVDCPPLAEPVWVDRSMWEKIVLNLLSNAFKFTFEGSIHLRLAPTHAGVRLEVADTGTGIAEAELPRLFERFHRIEGARSRSHEGSGIGLAFIQELVRLHGGTVEVTSRVGAGTTFSVFVPGGRAHLPEDRLRVAAPPANAPSGAGAWVEEALRWGSSSADRLPSPTEADDRPRILYADDNADMLAYVGRLLGERWRVDTVPDGAAALESVRRNPPDLVLCDVMMPNLDGFALVAEIRADVALRTLPVIILSARAGEEEAAKGLSSGANDYIAKPFSARDLLVRVASALATSRMMQEARRIEAAQRANLFRHFMQAPFSIAVLRGPSHVVELANPEILRVWGKGTEVLGLPLAQGLPEIVGQPFLGYLDAVFATGVAYQGREEAVLLPTGPNGALEQVYCNFVYAPLRDAQGTIEGTLVSAFVVTEQVRARHELERALVRAETSQSERARALVAAERISRSKDEFLATMSHELRTPLQAILGWATLLRLDQRDPAKLERGLTVIERNAQAQSRLVSDLLDVSRIISGKLRLVTRKTEVGAVVRAAVEVVRQAADAKGVRLAVDVDPEAGELVADPDRLQQIVWNLVSNAVKFTPAQGRIDVLARRGGSRVEIEVRDTGAGIAAEHLPFVFDRFSQGDGSITRAHGGLGLGLAIVRHLVEAHGGTVAARSDGPGAGAVFTVSLPVHAVHDGEPHPVPEELSLNDVQTPMEARMLQGLRILVVDDDPYSRELLEAVLQGEGATTIAVSSAREALAAAATGRFDVVVSDIGMPEMDGYALMRRLRGEETTRVPAIALTAYVRPEDAEEARRAGYQQHLAKPVDARVLVKTIRQVLATASAEPSEDRH